MKTEATPDLLPIAKPLLAWYGQHRRVLPFREDPTPYHVWVSEIMLQQTRVSAALPYYKRFMAALPNIEALAACEEQQLLKLWEGLGYYSRVRNLQKAAQIVVQQYGGKLPAGYEELKALPGIGPYTAGAIASISFGQPVVAVDGNVLRVFSRLLGSRADISLPATKKEISAAVQAAQPAEAPGDFNQALMELGALVCLPGAPNCGGCPLQNQCSGFKRGIAAQLPVAAPKKEKQRQQICVLLLFRGNEVLLHKRPAKGLLAGLWEPLLFEGSFTQKQAEALLAKTMPRATMEVALPKATHVFTHKIWEMYGWQCRAAAETPPPPGCFFVEANQLQAKYPIPSAFAAYLPLMLAGPCFR